MKAGRLAMLLALVAAANPRPRPPVPSKDELDRFEKRCRECPLVELGHLMMTACPTPEHLEVAERVAYDRLGTRAKDSLRGLEPRTQL